MQQVSLLIFLGIALLSIPTYMSGSAAQEAICPSPPGMPCANPGVSKTLIEAHEGAALLALACMEFTGAFAWLGLWQFRRIRRLPNWTLTAILLLSVATLGLMTRAANIGGDIRHPEITSAQEVAVSAAPLAREYGSWVQEVNWVWATLQTIHFLGLTLLFGFAALIDLRMLGIIRRISFPVLHRLMPWAILGFGMDLITGMSYFVAAPEQYTTSAVFHWKVILILLAGLNVAYFTISEKAWDLGPEDDAPLTAKAVAASAIVIVFGIAYCGHMLPFIGKAF